MFQFYLLIDNKSFYSPFYSKYNEEGFVPELFFNALTTTLFSLFIIISNFSLCYIFVKYRGKYSTLKSNTSTLLFIYAIIEILSQIIRLIYLVRVSIGLNFLPIWFAKFYIAYIVISYVSAYFMYILMGSDRLFAIAFPIL
uniref:G-protein coupled receptors family 1 profile domain-containing protein n=1 Tax=Meloidogyne enterolobii TaxID=390850 RepID=A0A6V7VLG9_MELEN|nr:unnamed protein product [Meloidogyne enterolobii]